MNRRCCHLALAVLLMLASAGCASQCADAIRAPMVPLELLAQPTCGKVPLDLTMLRQKPPANYVVGPRDVLGVYIQDILGRGDESPPVYTVNVNPGYAVNSTVGTPEASLVVGNPITVADDGTILLPRIPPLKIAGMTISQVDGAIRHAYTVDQKILQPNREQVNITLIRKRKYRITVVREDVGSPLPALKPTTASIISRRGTASVVELPAYENDVLHALALTGGLPGEDARNEVWVLRGMNSEEQTDALSNQLQRGVAPGAVARPRSLAFRCECGPTLLCRLAPATRSWKTATWCSSNHGQPSTFTPAA